MNSSEYGMIEKIAAPPKSQLVSLVILQALTEAANAENVRIGMNFLMPELAAAQ